MHILEMFKHFFLSLLPRMLTCHEILFKADLANATLAIAQPTMCVVAATDELGQREVHTFFQFFFNVLCHFSGEHTSAYA